MTPSPTPRESAEREQVARIIDPDAFEPKNQPDYGLRQQAALTKADAILAALPSLTRLRELEDDAARIDWLEQHTVNVRIPHRGGSSDLFWTDPDDCEGQAGRSDIRQAIDFRLARAAITSRGSGA